MNANDLKIVREKEVRERTGLSRATRWRMERKGEFPKRIALTKYSIGWLNSDIENWILGLLTNREVK